MLICQNCKHDLHPEANADRVTCQHCATSFDLTPSGYIRRIRLPQHIVERMQKEQEGGRV